MEREDCDHEVKPSEPACPANLTTSEDIGRGGNDDLVKSSDPDHPANLIPELCRKFYQLGWVTGRFLTVMLQATDQ